MKHINIETLVESFQNPDCFVSPDDLVKMRFECKEIAEAFKTLASYCEAKANAMECRLAGKITYALRFEEAAQAMYARLPKTFRW